MFGNPGTVEQGFLDALSSYTDFTYVLALQETVAVGIADGYARATELSIPLYLRPTISPKIWPIQGKMPPSLARSIMPLVAVSWYLFHESKVRKGATHEQD